MIQEKKIDRTWTSAYPDYAADAERLSHAHDTLHFLETRFHRVHEAVDERLEVALPSL